MSNPTAAILIIGDEILSGRTQDTNTHYLAGILTAAGIDLSEVRVVADEQPAIIQALNALRATYDHVFTSGGIGPTHDDITADSVATAFGVGIDIRADARAVMEDRYKTMGSTMNAARLRMARIPDGATLIENAVSGAPGFTLENVHVMAGVPSVFRAMVTAVMPRLTGGQPLIARSLNINRGESDIAGPLADLAARFPALSIGSYPYHHEGVYGANIVIRGKNTDQVNEAMEQLTALFPEEGT